MFRSLDNSAADTPSSTSHTVDTSTDQLVNLSASDNASSLLTPGPLLFRLLRRAFDDILSKGTQVKNLAKTKLIPELVERDPFIAHMMMHTREGKDTVMALAKQADAPEHIVREAKYFRQKGQRGLPHSYFNSLTELRSSMEHMLGVVARLRQLNLKTFIRRIPKQAEGPVQFILDDNTWLVIKRVSNDAIDKYQVTICSMMKQGKTRVPIGYGFSIEGKAMGKWGGRRTQPESMQPTKLGSVFNITDPRWLVTGGIGAMMLQSANAKDMTPEEQESAIQDHQAIQSIVASAREVIARDYAIPAAQRYADHLTTDYQSIGKVKQRHKKGSEFSWGRALASFFLSMGADIAVTYAIPVAGWTAAVIQFGKWALQEITDFHEMDRRELFASVEALDGTAQARQDEQIAHYKLAQEDCLRRMYELYPRDYANRETLYVYLFTTEFTKALPQAVKEWLD